MKQILQPNVWSCLPTAFAMALDVELPQLLACVGHDGSEVIWPELGEPQRRRSFHIQEMIYVARTVFDVAVTPVEFGPTIMPTGADKPLLIHPLGDFEEMLITADRAVITGISPAGSRHAVAWNGSKVYCPSGQSYAIEDFGIETVWLLQPIRTGRSKPTENSFKFSEKYY